MTSVPKKTTTETYENMRNVPESILEQNHGDVILTFSLVVRSDVPNLT